MPSRAQIVNRGATDKVRRPRAENFVCNVKLDAGLIDTFFFETGDELTMNLYTKLL